VRFPGADGKVEQKWFTDETSALEFAGKKREELGINGTAFGTIAETERSALSVWRDFVAKASSPPPDLVTVIREYAATWNQKTGSVTIRDASERYFKDQEAEEASDRHIASLKSRVGRLVADHGDSPVAVVDEGFFTDWLNGLRATRADKAGEKLNLTTRENLRRSCRTFFAFCKARGWTATNPVPMTRKKRTKAHRIANQKPVEIMLPADVEKFLRMVESIAPKILPFWCFKFFAGIRDSEAAQLTWEMIDMKGGKIDLPGAITKTGDPRTVKIEPVLSRWLASYVKDFGPVAPESIVARRFAYNKVLKRLRKPLEKGGKPAPFIFPSNAARHSFGTYHLYAFRNAGETALQLGHKGDPTMLHKHYSNPAAEEHAAAFWSIRPAKKTAKKPASPKKP
jgi:integrase